MLLSIVVPVYNTEPYLARCLSSLLDQDMDTDEFEIIVVNDGSDDGSLAIAEAYANGNPNIVIHSQVNRGVSVAMNTGLGLARGRFVYFVGSDDYIAPHTLGEIVAFMVREDLQVVTFGWVTTTPDQVVPDPGPPIVTDVRVMTGVEYIIKYGYKVEPPFYIYDRGFLLDVGIRFEEGRILEDVIFTSTAVSAATRMAGLPVRVYRYVKRPGSIMSMRSTAHMLRVTADWERAITGLDELRCEYAAKGTVPAAFLDRLAAQEQRFLFFLIGRIVRSEMPLTPTLTDALTRFRAMGIYPMDRFPTGEYRRQAPYHILTVIFNHDLLLRPFTAAVRLATRVVTRLQQAGVGRGRLVAGP